GETGQADQIDEVTEHDGRPPPAIGGTEQLMDGSDRSTPEGRCSPRAGARPSTARLAGRCRRSSSLGSGFDSLPRPRAPPAAARATRTDGRRAPDQRLRIRAGGGFGPIRRMTSVPIGPLRDGIVPTAAERVATADAPGRQGTALEQAVPGDRFVAILGTGW